MKRTPLKRTPFRRKKTKRLTDYETELELIRPVIVDRDKTCQAIGVLPHDCAMGWHVHHIKPRSRGGTNAETNLVLLCGIHHQHIHANPEWAYKTGFTK